MVLPTLAKEEISPPQMAQKKATAHIRISQHQEYSSVKDQLIEIEWPVESATELLVLIKGLTQ